MQPPLTVLAVLAITLAAAPATKADRVPVGLPIFTSDGKAIGKVLATGIDEDDKAVLVGGISRRDDPLGLSPKVRL